MRNFEKVIKTYNIKNYEILNFPDNQFDTIPLLKLIKVIENFLKKTNPMRYLLTITTN